MLSSGALPTFPWHTWEAVGLTQLKYEEPVVTDHGDLQEITTNNAIPRFVGVPQGPQVGTDPSVGEEPFPEWS